jgi:hypothetical protein
MEYQFTAWAGERKQKCRIRSKSNKKGAQIIIIILK